LPAPAQLFAGDARKKGEWLQTMKNLAGPWRRGSRKSARGRDFEACRPKMGFPTPTFGVVNRFRPGTWKAFPGRRRTKTRAHTVHLLAQDKVFYCAGGARSRFGQARPPVATAAAGSHGSGVRPMTKTISAARELGRWVAGVPDQIFAAGGDRAVRLVRAVGRWTKDSLSAGPGIDLLLGRPRLQGSETFFPFARRAVPWN